MTRIGQPEEIPEVTIIPAEDPVPRERPEPVPEKKPERLPELVPA